VFSWAVGQARMPQHESIVATLQHDAGCPVVCSGFLSRFFCGKNWLLNCQVKKLPSSGALVVGHFTNGG